jgi:hypothetical protein
MGLEFKHRFRVKMNWVCAQLCLVQVLILVKPAAKGFTKDKSYDVVISISYPNHFSFISCIHKFM